MIGARVVVVGAGIAGAACARVLRGAGIEVSVTERGRAAGGRMSSPRVAGRRVDVGAAYFTAGNESFDELVADWHRRGLVRPWADVLDVVGAAGSGKTSARRRWAAPGGLRGLVTDVLTGQDVRLDRPVTAVTVAQTTPHLDGDPADAVVLAMPDPQAARLAGTLPGVSWVDYEPVVTVIAGYRRRCWPMPDAVFVNDDPDLTLVADDGSRRGDRAAVLVAHTTTQRARQHLDDPDGAIPPVLAALSARLGVAQEPEWVLTKRWTFAKPAGTHGAQPFGLTDSFIGLAGDSWCPHGAPRVEAAWLSGHRLGAELVTRLGGSAGPAG